MFAQTPTTTSGQIAAYQFTVRLSNSGETVACKAGETLLAAIARTGKKGIPVGCRGGGCGVCKVEVLSGQVHTRQMSRRHVSEDDERSGRLLACCVYPASDLQVCAIGRLGQRLLATSTHQTIHSGQMR
ncbi:ferredoxin [Noviherbaspirillum sedimenti]|uniref:Ferredoxin n=2 Tax=Noviherbaspirillum sedimenti TaxID=2320865 RepID=A0A3A3GQ08_9BURK|nr:ferredoxin [Noviherbaspirillum sedimenti]